MRQIVSIIDPNFPQAQRETYREDGRRLLRLLKATKVDKTVRDEMRVFLASRDTLYKKTSLHKEITKYANPILTAGFGAETMGVYNPDTIPIDTYAKMKTDAQVAIGLSVIKMPIYSLGWTVECEDPDIKEFIRVVIAPIWSKLLKSMLTAVDYGFASHEMIWELVDLDIYTQTGTGRKKTHFSGKGEVLSKVKAHYPGSIKVRIDSKTDNFLGIAQSAGAGKIIQLDADKCFFFAINDEFGNYFGQSRLKPAYKPWYWREVLTQFMLRYFERRGSPTTTVTHPIGGGIDPSGTVYDNADIALRIGQNIVENGVVTLPFEADKGGSNKWGVTFLQDDRRGEMFVNALDYFGAQILRGLLTPERVMTQDLATGSFSMASSHADIFLLSEEGLVSEMEDAINTIIVPPLIQFNFKPNKLVPCKVRIEKIQYDRRRILKEILVEMIRNINSFLKSGKQPNIMPSIKEMSEVLGVPLSVVEEEYTEFDMPQAGVPGQGTPDIDEKGNPAKKPEDKGTGVTKKPKEEVTRTPVKKEPKKP